MSAQEKAGLRALAKHAQKRETRDGQIHCMCTWKTETMGQAAQQKSFRRHQIREVLAAVKDAEVASDSAGLLSRLSASGGRNIDLRKRARDAEAAKAAIRELHCPMWFNWVELDGTPGAGHICDHCTPEVGTELVHYPCPTINALEGTK